MFVRCKAYRGETELLGIIPMTILYPSALSSCPTSQASRTTSSRLPSDTVLEINRIFSGRVIACLSVILWAFVTERPSVSSRTNDSTSPDVIESILPHDRGSRKVAFSATSMF
jgi:hypothetical protein